MIETVLIALEDLIAVGLDFAEAAVKLSPVVLASVLGFWLWRRRQR